MVTRLSMIYIAKCWVFKRQHVGKVSIVDRRILRSICGKTRRDKVKNGFFEMVEVTFVEDKMKEFN